MRPIKPGKEQQDKLEQHFRENLRNMEVAPPAAMWDQIDTGLNQERNKIRYDHWYYVLLVLLLPFTATNIVLNYDLKDSYKAFLNEKKREESYGPRYNLIGAYPSQIRHLDHMNQRTIMMPLDMNYVDNTPYDEANTLKAIAKNTISPFVASNAPADNTLMADNSYSTKDYLNSLPYFDHSNLNGNGGLPLLGWNDGFSAIATKVPVNEVELEVISNSYEAELPITHRRNTKFEANKNSPLSLPKVKGLYIGGDIGANETQLVLRKSAFYPLIGENAKFAMKWGISYGVKVGFNFSRHFGVEAGCTINSAQAVTYLDNPGGKLPINGEIKLSYVHVPVVAKYKITRVSKLTGQPVSINIIGGIMYSHLKQASMQINESKLNDVKTLFAANEIGFIAGLEYDVYVSPNIFFNVGGKASITTDVNALPLVSAAKSNSYNILVGINAGINFQMPNKKREQIKNSTGTILNPTVMAPTPYLKAELVKSLSTKFYVGEDQGEFQIAMRYDGSTILYKNFNSYEQYKHQHDLLVKALNEDQQIPDDFIRI